MLLDGFKLPSLSTISHWHSEYSLIQFKALNLLKAKCDEMNEREKMCVLIHEAVKKELELKQMKAKSMGFRTLESKEERTLLLIKFLL